MSMKRGSQRWLCGAVLVGALAACRPPMSAVVSACPDSGVEGPRGLGRSASDVWWGCQHFDGADTRALRLPAASFAPRTWAVADEAQLWLGARAHDLGPFVVRVGVDGAPLVDRSADFEPRGDGVVVKSGRGAVYATQQVSGVQTLYVLREGRFVKLDAGLGLGDRLAAVLTLDDVLIESTGAVALKHWDGKTLRELPVSSGGAVVSSRDGDAWLLRGDGSLRHRRHDAWSEQPLPGDEATTPLGMVGLGEGRLGLVYAHDGAELVARTWDGARWGERRTLGRFAERGGAFVALGTLEDGTLVVEGAERDEGTGRFLVFVDAGWF